MSVGVILRKIGMGDGAPKMKAVYIIPFGLREEMDRRVKSLMNIIL